MSTRASYPSRELSAVTSEYSLKIQEDEKRTQDLQAQIEALQERLAENKRQAAENKQAARDHLFQEQCEEIHAGFRDMLKKSDHFIKLARRSLPGSAPLKYVQHLAEKGYEVVDSPAQFKAHLWDSIVGSHPDFNKELARLICQCEPQVNDEILDAFHSTSEAEGDSFGASPRQINHPIFASIEGDTADQQIDNSILDRVSGVPPEATTGGQIDRSEHLAKSAIELSTTSPKASSSDDDNEDGEDGQSTSTDDSSSLEDSTALPQHQSLQKKVQEGVKRAHSEISIASTNSKEPQPKKAKTTEKPKDNLTARARKFINHISNMAASGKAVDDELLCTVCKADPKNPRVMDCNHLYCLACFQVMRKPVPNAKAARALPCSKATCTMKIGNAHIMSNATLRELKEKYGGDGENDK